jgi:hypothetical protein
MAFVVRAITTQKNQGIDAFDPTKKKDENDIKKKKNLFDAQRSFKKNQKQNKKNFKVIYLEMALVVKVGVALVGTNFILEMFTTYLKQYKIPFTTPFQHLKSMVSLCK